MPQNSSDLWGLLSASSYLFPGTNILLDVWHGQGGGMHKEGCVDAYYDRVNSIGGESN